MMDDKRNESKETVTEKTTTENPAPPFGRGTEERTVKKTVEKESVEKEGK